MRKFILISTTAIGMGVGLGLTLSAAHALTFETPVAAQTAIPVEADYVFPVKTGDVLVSPQGDASPPNVAVYAATDIVTADLRPRVRPSSWSRPAPRVATAPARPVAPPARRVAVQAPAVTVEQGLSNVWLLGVYR